MPCQRIASVGQGVEARWKPARHGSAPEKTAAAYLYSLAFSGAAVRFCYADRDDGKGDFPEPES